MEDSYVQYKSWSQWKWIGKKENETSRELFKICSENFALRGLHFYETYLLWLHFRFPGQFLTNSFTHKSECDNLQCNLHRRSFCNLYLLFHLK